MTGSDIWSPGPARTTVHRSEVLNSCGERERDRDRECVCQSAVFPVGIFSLGAHKRNRNWCFRGGAGLNLLAAAAAAWREFEAFFVAFRRAIDFYVNNAIICLKISEVNIISEKLQENSDRERFEAICFGRLRLAHQRRGVKESGSFQRPFLFWQNKYCREHAWTSRKLNFSNDAAVRQQFPQKFTLQSLWTCNSTVRQSTLKRWDELYCRRICQGLFFSAKFCRMTSKNIFLLN